MVKHISDERFIEVYLNNKVKDAVHILGASDSWIAARAKKLGLSKSAQPSQSLNPEVIPGGLPQS